MIDTPPLLSVSHTLEIVPLVDTMLLCTRADQTTRDQAGAAKDALARPAQRTTAVVVTGLKPGRETDYGCYSHAYGEETPSTDPGSSRRGSAATPRGERRNVAARHRAQPCSSITIAPIAALETSRSTSSTRSTVRSLRPRNSPS